MSGAGIRLYAAKRRTLQNGPRHPSVGPDAGRTNLSPDRAAVPNARRSVGSQRGFVHSMAPCAVALDNEHQVVGEEVARLLAEYAASPS